MPPRWGLAGTVLWGLLIAFAYVSVQTFAMAFALLHANPGSSADDLPFLVESNVSNGGALAWATVAAAAIAIPLTFVAARSKRGSMPADYLGIRPTSIRAVVKWLAIALALGVLLDAMKWSTGGETVPRYAIDVYESRGSILVFWLGLTVMAPLAEEMFFRGFVLAGFERTFLGRAGAVVATAAIWAVIHTQYEWFDVLTIFALGVVLGASRVATGSLAPAVAIHVATNVLAFAAAAVMSSRLEPPVY